MTSVESGSETRLSDIFFASLCCRPFFSFCRRRLCPFTLHPSFPPFSPLSVVYPFPYSLLSSVLIVGSIHSSPFSFTHLYSTHSLLSSFPPSLLHTTATIIARKSIDTTMSTDPKTRKPASTSSLPFMPSLLPFPYTLYFFSFSLLPPHHCQPVFPQSTYLGSSLSLQAFSFINTHFTQHTPAHKRTQRCYKYQTTFPPNCSDCFAMH